MFVRLLILSMASAAVHAQQQDLIFLDGFESGGQTVWGSPCLSGLNARGVDFRIRDWTPQVSPNGQVCDVEEPVYLGPTVRGVDLLYVGASEPSEVFLACAGATALADTLIDLATVGANALVHIGTYSCREIAGTSELSQHALGRAIDLHGVHLEDGTIYTVLDDWEHETTSPSTPGGIFLWEAVNRWHESGLWNVITTPNYNGAHDNHVHCALNEGAWFLE